MKEQLTRRTSKSALFRKLFLGGVCLFLTAGAGKAQCTLACDNLVYISLGQNCEAEVGYADLLLDPGACYPNDPDDYLVEIYNNQGSAVLPSSPMVNASLVNQTLPVKVTHLFTGAFCFAAITVVDGTPPQISCPANTTINCTIEPLPSLTGSPFVLDCFPTLITFEDHRVNLGCEDPQAKIERTWTVEDIYGNTSSCEQIIWISLPSMADIEFPPSYDNLDLPALDCLTNDISPAVTGAPSLQGNPLPTDNSCSFSSLFLDQVIPNCGSSYSVIRTWTVVEWCTGTVLSQPQIIKLEDTSPPNITVPDTLFFAANDPNSCTSTLEFPGIAWEDDCSDTVLIEIQTPYGTITGNWGLLPDVGIGAFSAVCQVEDLCGNQSQQSVWVIVQDQLAPTMVCDQLTIVHLDADGWAEVPANVFDDGSVDNCCLTYFQVARMESACGETTDFASTVAFCCEDAGKEIPLRLRASDCFGNTNECEVLARVVDKTAPVLDCPENLTISCTAAIDPTEYPNLEEACSIDTLYYQDHFSFNGCPTGQVERTWYAIDQQGNQDSCWQLITVVDDTPLEISYPADFILTACGSLAELHPDSLPAAMAYPQITGDDCELVAVNYSDQVFTIATQSCFQVSRTWTIIDWCVFDPNAGNSLGQYQYVQLLELIDEDPPEILCPADLSILATNDSCQGTVILEVPQIIDCSEEHSVIVNTPWGTGTGPFAEVPLGTYEATYTVFDACGNGSTCTIEIDVVDGKKPNPYCVNGVAASLQVSALDSLGNPLAGSATIHVNQLDQGSYDACSEVQISFSPDLADTLISFSCDDVGQNAIELWVTDHAGNQGFCSTWIAVQDPNEICVGPENLSLGGVVYNEMGQPVEGATAFLLGADTLNQTTLVDGTYQFDSLPYLTGYAVRVERNMDLLNGLTTWDLAKIKQHVLGVELLDSPYKIIAADANRSGSVTTVDILHFQKLILLLSEQLPNGNQSWRFVPASYQFQNPQNPLLESFPEYLQIDTLQSTMMDLSWVGIKVGDVNNSSLPNLNAWGPEVRTKEQLELAFPSRYLGPEEEVWLPITFAHSAPIMAIQGGLRFGPDIAVEAFRFPPGSPWNPEDFHLIKEDHEIRFAAAVVQEAIVEEGDVFIEVLISRQKPGLADAGLAWNPAIPAEAYGASGRTLALSWKQEATRHLAKEGLKHRIFPHPVKAGTVIELEGLSPGTVWLELFNARGQLIWQTSWETETSEYTFSLPPSVWPQAGTYWYRISGPERQATGKLLYVPD